jgi:ABC-type taurine transport system ATPase subunit
MLTKLTVRNFKRFEEVEIELGSPVVFIGPNNSGKTTALQALALWELGLRRWHEKRGMSEVPGKRPGVAINRRDFIAAPIPNASLLWRDLHVRDVQKVNGKPDTSNVRIDVLVTGVSNGTEWNCGFEFDYANEESFYCRPLRTGSAKDASRMPVPEQSLDTRIAFLPPMSGLADREFAKQPGEVAHLIGQGKTADVLRNLCLQVVSLPENQRSSAWSGLRDEMERLFGIRLLEPDFVAERAEITLSYKDKTGCILDISCSGRGVQQTLLLLAYMYVNPSSVMLLDEPDAHLEILRQREVYRILCESAAKQGSQIIVASHSEIILNEAADKDVVVAFVGKPHRIDDRGSQVLKSLKEIGFDQYYQAEQNGWVLYLEGATDLAVLQAFARRLGHPVSPHLERVFVHYVLNQPERARSHFYGIQEAKKDLVGILICDRLDRNLQGSSSLVELMWKRREIENYLCQPATLRRFATSIAADYETAPLFAPQRVTLEATMDDSIRELVPPLALSDPSFQYWTNVKASDEFLDVLFERFFNKLGLDNLMRKTNYHRLADFVDVADIAPEIYSVLDKINEQANRAQPQ